MSRAGVKKKSLHSENVESPTNRIRTGAESSEEAKKQNQKTKAAPPQAIIEAIFGHSVRQGVIYGMRIPSSARRSTANFFNKPQFAALMDISPSKRTRDRGLESPSKRARDA